MKRYLKIFFYRLKLSQQSAFQFRMDYFLRIVRAVLDVVTALVLINTFYSHVPDILGWGKYESLLVYGIYQFTAGFVYFVAGHGVYQLPFAIIQGSFDEFLTKPIDSQFAICTAFLFMTNAHRSILGLAVVIYTLTNLSLTFTLPQLLLVTITILSSIFIFFEIIFITSTTSFWTNSLESNDLMGSLVSTCRFPINYYQKIKYLFYIIPMVFIATIPANVILGRYQPLAFISPIVAAVLFIAMRKFWFFGLKSYQSASS